MKERLKRWLRPALFTLGGALAGLGSMLYMGVVGWLLSGAFGAGCRGSCKR